MEETVKGTNNAVNSILRVATTLLNGGFKMQETHIGNEKCSAAETRGASQKSTPTRSSRHRRCAVRDRTAFTGALRRTAGQ
jgi:hypothetical protein